MSERVVVIGGNAAGMTAASRAKRLDPSLDVRVFEASDQIAYSICGLPFLLSRDVSHYQRLVLFTPERLLNERGIHARTETPVIEIRPHRRSILVEPRGSASATEEVGYDRLLIATGYRPRVPAVAGLEGAGVFTASRISDGPRIERYVEKLVADGSGGRNPRALLLGGGYIGLEMAQSLAKRGLDVTIVDSSDHLLAGLDAEMAELVEDRLRSEGVELYLGRSLDRIERVGRGPDGRLETAVLRPGQLRLPVDLVFVDTGVEPRVDLAERCGIKIGSTGAIEVNDWLETSQPAVFAAGNCAETLDLVSGRMTRSVLGTVAVKQGRVAGENLAGRRNRFSGAVATSAVQVFGLHVARTGLSSAQAAEFGFDVVDSRVEGSFQAGYFDGGAKAVVKATADRKSLRLLGFQIVGSREGALRIDAAATAIQAGLGVEEAAQLDLAYTPPLGSLWNPLLVALNTLRRKL